MYKRDEVDSLGSVNYYQQWGKVYGLEFVDYVDYSNDLADHYAMVRSKPVSRNGCLVHTWASTSTNKCCGINKAAYCTSSSR